MQSDNVSPAEWRWVAIFSGFLVTLTLIPYAWALLASDGNFEFMGILSNPKDGATYLSKIQQGIDGAWLFELRHTPEPHDPAGFHLFYLLLGQIARILGFSSVVAFHLARVATSFFMFAALYHLGATIWHRLRPRRLFFMLISVGSGLGWLTLVLDNDALAPDLTVPEAFPLLAAYTNPHFPLAIGAMALMASQLMTVFRPGYEDAPTVENGGLLLVLLAVILAIVSPPGILAIGGALTAYMLARTVIINRKKFGNITYDQLKIGNFELPWHEVRWSSMVILPAVPFAVYFFAVFRFNDMFSRFNDQNITESPNLILFVMGYGLLFLVAVPGLVRAFRRFERDGDQFMLMWIVFSAIAIYLPFALQRRMFIGLIIPLVYFAVRALEDYWVQHVPRKRQMPAMMLLFVFILPTHAFTFGAPLAIAVLNRDVGADNLLLVETDYIDAFDWLNEHSREDSVVMAAPSIGLWMPSETLNRPVYGHEFETVPAEIRLEQVEHFYEGEACDEIYEELPVPVSYVLWGPQEESLGLVEADDERIDLADLADDIDEDEKVRLPTADLCREDVMERATETLVFGDVSLYILPGN